jgi:cytochrome b subunit of formate dehydrogenase
MALFMLCALFMCVFASVTFNFGPCTITFPHLDFLNLAWGWCFITALGWFNHELGGHLILWDLWPIIGFLPGMTIAIPSAIFCHSNISIQQDKKWFSITQYTSTGVFCFMDSRQT